MSASRLTWLVALWGAVWTWLLASWSGISPATSLLRAATVFVTMAAVMIGFQVVLDASKGTKKPTEDRPDSEELPASEEPQQEQKAA